MQQHQHQQLVIEASNGLDSVNRNLHQQFTLDQFNLNKFKSVGLDHRLVRVLEVTQSFSQ